MWSYIAQKVGLTILVLLGVTLLVFITVQILPGDAVDSLIQEMGNPKVVAEFRAELGLDQPAHIQYLSWLGKAVRGDLGRSLTDRQPVAQRVVQRYGATMQLALVGLLVAAGLGIMAGVVCAARANSAVDFASMLVALLGVSIPSFLLGLLLMLLFALKLGVLPAAGMGTLRHLVLPALTLGLSSAGLVARLTRSAMLDVISQEYVRTARAKGLTERVVLFRHALANAMLPIVTILGLQLGFLLGGAVVVESVFAWPGMGTLIVEAATRRDYVTLQGAMLVFAVSFATVNLMVDMTYLLIDPRVRYE